jgi:uncharacterized DUF497 family protein
MDTLHQTPFGSFEWDSRKNDANIEKHGLDFVDVVLVFQDSYARIEMTPSIVKVKSATGLQAQLKVLL